MIASDPAASASLDVSAAWRDWLGVAASIACAIHCAAMPLVIGFLPVFGLSFLADPSFHQWMAVACFAVAISSFVPGWGRHRRLAPGVIAVAGLTLITGAAFSDRECCPAASVDPATPTATVDQATAWKTTPTPTEPATPTESAPSTSCSSQCQTACAAAREVDAPAETPMGRPTVASATATEQTALPGWVWAWLTPLGGLLLVSAHLLNRYWICRCRCAGTCRG